MLTRRAGAAANDVDERTWAALERRLLGSLVWLSGRCLQLEFEQFRAGRQSALAGLLASTTGSRDRTLYNLFTNHLRGGHLMVFLHRYAMLARLLAEEVEHWVASSAEFLQRLRVDRAEIQRTFGDAAGLGRVKGIHPGLSDPHNGGRTAHLITFDGGLKLIYKPRPVTLEAAFSRFVAWMNERGLPLQLDTLDVLERSGYGWVRFVEPVSCTSWNQATRFYRRTGELLAILYLLSGRDLHFENIIACGEQPVPVDLETLLYPELKADRHLFPQETGPPGDDQFVFSVLDTGLLPHRLQGPGGGSFDLSALGHFEEQSTFYQEPVWRNFNTDAMHLELRIVVSSPASNVPTLNGSRLRPDDHGAEIIAGFQATYRFLMAQRSAVLAPDGPLVRLAGLAVRFIARPTQLYTSLLMQALRPKYLRDGVDFGIELDVLCRPLLKSAEKPRLWPLLGIERNSLEGLDIPYFTASSGSDSLQLGPDEIIEECFTAPSYQVMTKRLRGFDEEDLERQVEIIRTSLETVAPPS